MLYLVCSIALYLLDIVYFPVELCTAEIDRAVVPLSSIWVHKASI
jgi:hypothetical protein